MYYHLLMHHHLIPAMHGGHASKQLFLQISRKRNVPASPNTSNRVRRAPGASEPIRSSKSSQVNSPTTIYSLRRVGQTLRKEGGQNKCIKQKKGDRALMTEDTETFVLPILVQTS